MTTTKRLLMLAIIIAVLTAIWYGTGMNKWMSFELLQAHHGYFKQLVADNYLLAAIIFVSIYTALISAAVPASPPLTLLGSYLFGFVPGFLYSFLSCMLGATLSFLVVKYVVKRWLSGKRHTERVEQFNVQFKKYGASYLLMLHFLSVIPYIIITILAALADVPLRTFVWTCAVGSVPLLLIYSWTARQLASLHSVHDIFSVRVLIVLALLIALAVVPIILRRYKHRFGM